MDELAQLRAKKLKELQESTEEQQDTQQQFENAERAVKMLLDKDALQRYGNIKAADREKAAQIIIVLAQLAQAGKIRRQLNDGEFRRLLAQLTPERRDITIKHR